MLEPRPALELARAIADATSPPLRRGRDRRVYLLYNEFQSAHLAGADRRSAPAGRTRPGEASTVRPSTTSTSRDAPELLDALLPLYVDARSSCALLESVACEHGARMTAMENATSNACEMIDRLTLSINRARQAAITKELMEIVGGAEALKG